MRKSHARTRARLWGAGAATALTAASALVGTSPAFALTAVTNQTPTAGPASGTITVTLSGMLTGVTAPYTIFTPNPTCTDSFATNAANIAATTRKVSDDEAQITIPATLSLSAGAARKYMICIYASSASGAAGKGQGSYVLTPIGAVTPTTGPSGGGNTLTFTTPSGSAPFTTTPGADTALFTASGGCPATHPQAGTRIRTQPIRQTTSQVTVTVPAQVAGNAPAPGSPAPPPTSYTVCFYPGTGASDQVMAQSTVGGYTVQLAATSLNQAVGAPYVTASNTPNLTIESPTAFLTGVTDPAVLFTPAACSAVFPTNRTDLGLAAAAITSGVDFNPARKLTNTKAAVAAPSIVTVATGTVNVCTYSSSSGGRLLGSTQYTPVAVPVVSSISPSAGSPLGGNLVTVTGSNLPIDAGAMTVTLGGSPLTNITPINATTFTAVTPPHTQGVADLSLTTAAGTSTRAGVYTFLNSIAVTPNTAPNTASAVDLDILGTGFENLNFTDTPNQDAKVYLVDGKYVGTGGTAYASAAGTARNYLNPVSACTNVLVIGETELICRLNLTGTLDALGIVKGTGYYTASDFVSVQNSAILTSAGANFTKGDIGKTLVQTGGASEIPAGATVADVINSTTILMSEPSTIADGTGLQVTLGTAPSSRGSITNTTTVNTLTGSASTFTQADVGRYVTKQTGAGAIPSGTYIVSVNDDGSIATLSNNVTGTISAVHVSLTSNAVPTGSYNIVVVSNATPNAPSGDPAYAESAMTSSSTFTVANY
ncbi:IPT/TIG domain-containing protein [Actinoplanes sp. NPDC049802]|uniref:IPT/TIG domain-containing protein n=1 Tax=Actinoplanes sp. NPDC049802 TaxID=3154742 RepID=UPI003408284E